MTKSTFSVVFSSDILVVKHVVKEALDYIGEAFPVISNEVLFDIKLLMNELLLNAVTHGNNGDINKKVSFEIKIVGLDSVLIKVTDEGTGFDYLSVAEGQAGENLLRETGRGIKIVSSIADEVYYKEQGNEFKIYKKVVSNG